MKKYNSIKEMEEDKIKQTYNWNKACIDAMTDKELSATLEMILKEQTQRKIDDEISERNRIAISSNSDY